MEEYYLIHWPESQNYMEEPWFDKEAYLCQTTNPNQVHFDMAFFIPKKYINESR